jgi:hypothetical protein
VRGVGRLDHRRLRRPGKREGVLRRRPGLVRSGGQSLVLREQRRGLLLPGVLSSWNRIFDGLRVRPTRAVSGSRAGSRVVSRSRAGPGPAPRPPSSSSSEVPPGEPSRAEGPGGAGPRSPGGPGAARDAARISRPSRAAPGESQRAAEIRVAAEKLEPSLREKGLTRPARKSCCPTVRRSPSPPSAGTR